MGSSADWLAGQGIPALAVVLTNHHQTEFRRNLKGVLALIRFLLEINTD